MARKIQHPQLSYDALLIHGVMFLFAGGTVAACLLLSDIEEWIGAVAVGVPATVVLWVWSLVLVVRAKGKRECSRWPTVIFFLCVLELLSSVVIGVILDPPDSKFFWGLFFVFFVSSPALALVLSQVVRYWLGNRRSPRL